MNNCVNNNDLDTIEEYLLLSKLEILHSDKNSE